MGENFSSVGKNEIDIMNGKEHTIPGEDLKEYNVKYLIIRYYIKNGKDAENLIKIAKPLNIQTEYTLQINNTSKCTPPIIKNLPEIKKKECTDNE